MVTVPTWLTLTAASSRKCTSSRNLRWKASGSLNDSTKSPAPAGWVVVVDDGRVVGVAGCVVVVVAAAGHVVVVAGRVVVVVDGWIATANDVTSAFQWSRLPARLEDADPHRMTFRPARPAGPSTRGRNRRAGHERLRIQDALVDPPADRVVDLDVDECRPSGGSRHVDGDRDRSPLRPRRSARPRPW